MEEKVHENEEQIEWLTNEKREAARQMREMEGIYEAERGAMMKEKEEMANREEEMQTVIQRLKDSLAQRNSDEDRPSRQCKLQPDQGMLTLEQTNASDCQQQIIHQVLTAGALRHPHRSIAVTRETLPNSFCKRTN